MTLRHHSKWLEFSCIISPCSHEQFSHELPLPKMATIFIFWQQQACACKNQGRQKRKSKTERTCFTLKMQLHAVNSSWGERFRGSRIIAVPLCRAWLASAACSLCRGAVGAGENKKEIIKKKVTVQVQEAPCSLAQMHCFRMIFSMVDLADRGS